MEVVVTGVNARRVWVRREYEALVRAGIAGLSADRTIFGHTQASRNVVNSVLSRLQFVEDCRVQQIVGSRDDQTRPVRIDRE